MLRLPHIRIGVSIQEARLNKALKRLSSNTRVSGIVESVMKSWSEAVMSSKEPNIPANQPDASIPSSMVAIKVHRVAIYHRIKWRSHPVLL